jgi:hypothetical protein
MLAHHVYFTLHDNAPQKCGQLIDACKKYLTDHPGTVFFSAGVLTPDLAREVNDRDFDIALSVVFESRADHDAYQIAPRHKEFIEQHKASWKTVRIFDSDA